MRVCIAEPKTRKAYQVEKDAPSLIGMKIGEKFEGSVIGLNGFTLEITGGSDKEGFPMRKDLPGFSRKKVLLTSGPGFRSKVEGMRKRKYVRGNTVFDGTMQLNCKIVEGEGDVMMILGIQPKAAEGAAEEKK